MFWPPPSQNPRWHPSWLNKACTTRKDSESEWLTKDNPETNPITIQPEAAESHGRAVLLGSLKVLLSTQVPFLNKVSWFVSICVSSDNSFSSVRQQPSFRPWKGSPFLQQVHASTPKPGWAPLLTTAPSHPCHLSPHSSTSSPEEGQLVSGLTSLDSILSGDHHHQDLEGTQAQKKPPRTGESLEQVPCDCKLHLPECPRCRAAHAQREARCARGVVPASSVWFQRASAPGSPRERGTGAVRWQPCGLTLF